VNGQPHIVFVVEHGPDPSFLASLEDIVPGTLVYGRLSSGARRHRLHKAIELGTADGFTTGSFGVYDVVVPVHGAWLVEAQLTTSDASYQRRDEASAQLATLFWQDTEEFREAALRRGKSATKSAVAGGTLRPHVLDIATPYQFAGVAWSCARPWVMSVWACGSGKTLGAIMAATAYGGPVLVVAPAKARHVWWSQVQEYTTLKPFRIRPKSDMRKNEQTLSEYLLECESTKQYPFVIVGAESLSDNLEAIRTVEPEVLILDELHTHGSKKRWRAIPQADGSVSFERRKTAASERVGSKVDRENRAVAAMEVSRLPSLQLRIGLTATPLDDGRTRRLWSQLDLLAPGGFSHSYSRFAKRYCDARPGEYGGLDDKGSSNMDELKSRCSWIMHEVPYSESHAALPDTRVQVVYLSSTELNRAERWNDNKPLDRPSRASLRKREQKQMRMHGCGSLRHDSHRRVAGSGST
jgi:hypothetical protein